MSTSYSARRLGSVRGTSCFRGDRIQRKRSRSRNVEFAGCFHGGAFFEAIGHEFDRLERRHEIINADVLDAWFDPAPVVTAALQQHLPWLVRTSPPAACEGLITALSSARGVPTDALLPGAGSSDLIFRAFCHWLTSNSRTLIIDPTYGEYPHVLEQVIGCHVDRLFLHRESAYQLNLTKLEEALAAAYDLVILINPNSPTGSYVSRTRLEEILRTVPSRTRIWIDETYIEYLTSHDSLERFAAQSTNVIVCKSMSKVYALSGMRVGYLCGPPSVLKELRAITPPWAVGLPAQVTAVAALRDPDYYNERYQETHHLRSALAVTLSKRFGWDVIAGTANFLLCHLPPNGSTAARLVGACRERGLFLRDASGMGQQLGAHAIRIAVKDREITARMVEILGRALLEASRK